MLLLEWEIKVSIGRQVRYRDNIFVERLWRSIRYEKAYLRDYCNGSEARIGINAYLDFHNRERPHQALRYRTPPPVFVESKSIRYLPK